MWARTIEDLHVCNGVRLDDFEIKELGFGCKGEMRHVKGSKPRSKWLPLGRSISFDCAGAHEADSAGMRAAQRGFPARGMVLEALEKRGLNAWFLLIRSEVTYRKRKD